MKKLSVIFALVLSFVLLCTFMATPALAAKSPEGELVYKIDVTSFATGNATPGRYIVEGDTVRLIAAEKSDYAFMGWHIEGEYEIVSGTLKSKVLVIRPLSDIKVEEMYNVKGSLGYVEPDDTPDKEPTKPNESPEAPQTSDNTLPFALMLVAVGVSAMLYSKKRLVA